jgi:hypothetical protein
MGSEDVGVDKGKDKDIVEGGVAQLYIMLLIATRIIASTSSCTHSVSFGLHLR